MRFYILLAFFLFMLLGAFAIKADDEGDVKWYCSNVVIERHGDEWHVCGKSENWRNEILARRAAWNNAAQSFLSMNGMARNFMWDINPQRTVCKKNQQGWWDCTRYFIIKLTDIPGVLDENQKSKTGVTW